jgi:hypothetical protein
MRSFSIVTPLVVVFLSGCVTAKQTGSDAVPAQTRHSPNSTFSTDTSSAPAPMIVTPDQVLAGKVARVNEAGRFVVLEFPVSHLPALGQMLFVYRNGLKVAEVKITGPQRDDHTVADLTTGEALPGDEVRDK